MKHLCVCVFAARNAFRRRNLTLITLGVIALGIGLFSAIAPILENMNTMSEKYLKSVGDIIIYQNATNIYTSQVPVSIADNVSLMEGVLSADPEIVIMLLQSHLLDENVSIMPYSSLFGLDRDSNERHGGLLTAVVRGRPFEEGRNEVVIGSRLADTNALDIGNTLMIGMAPYDIVGIYTTGTVINDASFIIGIDAARNMTRAPAITPGNCSFISVKMKDPAYTDGVSREVEEGYDVATSYPRNSLKGALDTIDMIRSAAYTIAGVVLVSSFLITSSVLFMNVKERLREFALFKAVGWSNGDVIECVLVEALALSLVGGVVGIVAGTVLTFYLQVWVLYMPLLLQSVRTMLLTLAMTVILALVSGIYPAYRASRSRPGSVLRGG